MNRLLRYIIFVCIILISNKPAVFAQKHCNLGLTIIAPANGSEIPYGDTAFLRFSVKNLGPDTVDSTDTIYINMTNNPYSRGINHYIAPDDTANDIFLYAWNNLPADDTMSFCLFLMADLNISITDTIPANDSSCVTFILKGSGTGIIDLAPLTIKELSLYPNPAHTEVKLFPGMDMPGSVIISVTDITGRSCLGKHIEQWNPATNEPISIDVSTLQPGLYLVELKTKESRKTSKLLVE